MKTISTLTKVFLCAAAIAIPAIAHAADDFKLTCLKQKIFFIENTRPEFADAKKRLKANFDDLDIHLAVQNIGLAARQEPELSQEGMNLLQYVGCYYSGEIVRSRVALEAVSIARAKPEYTAQALNILVYAAARNHGRSSMLIGAFYNNDNDKEVIRLAMDAAKKVMDLNPYNKLVPHDIYDMGMKFPELRTEALVFLEGKNGRYRLKDTERFIAGLKEASVPAEPQP